LLNGQPPGAIKGRHGRGRAVADGGLKKTEAYIKERVMNKFLQKIKIVFLTGLLALGLGCQSWNDGIGGLDPRPQPAQTAYEQAIAPYLGQIKIYAGPATGLIANALPLTPAVRRAQVEREAEARSFSPEQRQEIMARQLEAAAAGFEVIVSVSTPELIDNQLNAPDPSWRVFIELDDGRQLDPVDVREIKTRERGAMLEALYPFWKYWDRLFRLRFSPLPALNSARLAFSGPEGNCMLDIKLD
jgi:hypothetical protein